MSDRVYNLSGLYLIEAMNKFVTKFRDTINKALFPKNQLVPRISANLEKLSKM